MKAEVNKPPDSPMGDVNEWRRQRQEWVNATWATYMNGADSSVDDVPYDNPEDTDLECEALLDDEPATREEEIGGSQHGNSYNGSQDAPVTGALRPLVAEGERVMVCVGYKVVKTRYGLKDYLYWWEAAGSPLLEQYSPHYDKYPVSSKAVENYIVAMGQRPTRLDRMSFRRFIGLKANVYVEKVKPTYTAGALKGKEKPEATHYSKVSEILAPVGHVDTNTLRKLRGQHL